MFNIKYNNVQPSAFNAWLATIPVITPSTISRTRQTVPKMDGELLVDDDSFMDAYIEFTIHLKRDDLQAKMRQIRKWLSGTGTLVISDANDAYYEVKEVTHTAYLKKDEKYGRVSVKMEVYPYEFLNSGNDWITSYSSISNTADICKPIYEITGNNASGTLTVNNHAMTFSGITGTLVIDTRTRTAYVTYNGSRTQADSKINGDYEGLLLKSGSNTVSCTAGTLRIKPRWGFRI